MAKLKFWFKMAPMKTITSLLAVCFLLITGSIIYIIRSGVSIRTAPIIKPSVISRDFRNVPQGLFLRLFPDFQQADYVLWGGSQNSGEVQTTLALAKEHYEREFKRPVNFIYEGEKAHLEAVANCPKPCWILLPENKAHELTPNAWVQTNLLPLHKTYFTLTWVNFKKNISVPAECTQEKRLDLPCLISVSVREVGRKMPDPQQRYFFMRKYLDSDYFLFVEEPLQP